MRRFEGRVAIVTGGANGIGAATARRLAQEGAKVVIADLEAESGLAVAADIGASGGEAFAVSMDAAVASAWSDMVRAVADRYGRIDVVHSNTGWARTGPTHQLTEEDWQLHLDICLKPVFLAVQTCIEHLRTTHGSMVITSSVHALMGIAGFSAYAAAKGAICSLTRALAAEYGPDVRINTVIPGAVQTRALGDIAPEELRRIAEQTAIKRIGKPEEIAAAVAFLASGEASYITGENLVVDGGWTVVR